MNTENYRRDLLVCNNMPHKQLLIVLTSILVIEVNGACRESFMTLCDTFEDFANYNNSEQLSELIIGSEKEGNSRMTSVNFMEILQLDKYQLSSLIIIKSVNQLLMTYPRECLYITSSLKYLNLYGNDLKRIERFHFPLMPLKKFSLVNNKIEGLGQQAFLYQSMEELDLSDNFLETIEYKALPVTRAIKVLTIRNNKLSHIPLNSLPISLTSLHLDKNNLRFLEDKTFDKLNDLQTLTLSHNKLNDIPDISHMTKLVILDVSFNEIEQLTKENFRKMDKLKLLDLSNNRISHKFCLKWLTIPKKQPSLTISLALNKIKDLDLKDLDLQNRTFLLYGNPWNCTNWSNLKRQLSGHESTCDMEFLSDASTPFCIGYNNNIYNYTKMWDFDIEEYHTTVKSNKKLSQCTLELKKHQLLYPVDFFCVNVNQ